jgi:hypothetical protein
LVNILSDGMNAGIGNLIAEGNDKNTMKVFWELTAIRFLIVGVIVFALLMFTQSFIVCWLGSEYLLSDIILYLLVFNLFIFFSRGVVEMYISACGLYQDVWAAWTELALNLTITLCLAPFYGIIGILLGKIVSVFFLAIFWKPYFLFNQGLHQKVSVYWRGMLPFYLTFFIFSFIVIIIKIYIIDTHVDTFTAIIGYAIITYIPILLLYCISLFIVTNGMKYFIARKPVLYRIANKILQH